MVKNENDVWKYLNSARKKKEKIENQIRAEDWKRHFVELLEGSEEKKVGIERQACESTEEKEKEKITAIEIKGTDTP